MPAKAEIFCTAGEAPATTGATGTTILNITHDAHWIPEGVPNAGYLVGFNNNGQSGAKSYVDQVSPPDSEYWYKHTSGSAFSPSSYDLRHTCNGHTSNMGNSQQLPNGNMLVCVALSGLIYEIDPSGNTLWTKTIAGSVPQAFRYSKCYTDNAAPATPTITISGTDLSSSTGTTYQWYMNGTIIQGATSQTYTPTKPGNFVVRVTDANGCAFSYSNTFKYTVGGNNGVANTDFATGINVYPNPSTGIVNVDFNGLSMASISLNVFDVTGRKIATTKSMNQVDLSNADNGIYYLVISSGNAISITQKISILK